MIRSNLDSPPGRTERTNVHRQRHQKGSLQVRQHGKRKMWALLYRDGSTRKYATLGLYSKLSKSQAEEKRDELLNEVTARNAVAPDPHITFGEFLEGIALPFLRSKWKRSTAATTENRITHHLKTEFGEEKLSALTLKGLQMFLNGKAASLSRSVVAHLRWDLRAIFKLAIAEGYAERDPTGALYAPKAAVTAESRSMNKEEVDHYITVLELRERVIAHLAIFSGMRPGEILALQRRHISGDCRHLSVDQRLYRGDIDTPKTNSSTRTVAIPPKTANHLREWMELVGRSPKAWVFASENALKPMWRDNVWYRHMKPLLDPISLW
jgi:integrase